MTEPPAIATSRESLISRTFLQLTDTLIADFDIIDLLTILSDRCVVLTDADAAGILLVDSENTLRVMAASSEQARLLELFQIQNSEGPCLEAFSTGLPVIDTNLTAAIERWPRFSQFALQAGFQSAYALPLRLRGTVIGALNLFRTSTKPMADADVALVQALADVACIAILQDQAARAAQRRDAQLQHALDSRVIIEQAKGMVAERARLDMDSAFKLIRAYARNNNIQLTLVAASIVAGKLTLPSDVGEASTS